MKSVDQIHVGSRFRKDVGDLSALAASISRVGLLHPVVVTPKDKLIVGHRRLEACKKLGWREVPVRTSNLQDILRGENDENAVRKDLLPSEAVAIAKALEPEEKEASKERQAQAGPSSGKGEKKSAGGKLPHAVAGKTRDKVARHTGMGERTLAKAMEIVEAAEKEPKKFGPLVEEMDRTERVSGVHRKLKIQRQVEASRKEPQPLPKGPFRVIVVDPPWPYRKGSKVNISRRSQCPYPEMSLEEIAALPIGKLSTPDSVLWLWTTNAFMRASFDLIDSWGFTHKTILTWAKDKMGTGDWLRGKTEHCILAAKGKPTINLTNQTTLLHGKMREHSRKPEEFFKLVEGLCPGSKLEMFARESRKDWVSYGDETAAFS